MRSLADTGIAAKSKILRSANLQCSVLKIKAELDQFREGLQLFGRCLVVNNAYLILFERFLEFIKCHPDEMFSFFCFSKEEELTAGRQLLCK